MPAPTYLSLVEFPGDGVTTAWDFNFAGGYISRSHVKAWTRDANGIITDLTVVDGDFITDFRLTVAPAVPVGQTLRIYRETPRDAPLVNFASGSNLTKANLDLLAQQAVFSAAEAFDAGQYASAEDLIGQANAAIEAASGLAAASAAAVAAQIAAAASASSAAGSAAVAATARAVAEDFAARADSIESQIASIAASYNIRTWATGQTYSPGTIGSLTARRDAVLVGGQWYVAALTHTAGAVFATDLAAGKWLATDAVQLRGDLATVGTAKGADMVVNSRSDLGGAQPSTLAAHIRRSKINVARDFNLTPGSDITAAMREVLADGRGWYLPGTPVGQDWLISDDLPVASFDQVGEGDGVYATRIRSTVANKHGFRNGVLSANRISLSRMWIQTLGSGSPIYFPYEGPETRLMYNSEFNKLRLTADTGNALHIANSFNLAVRNTWAESNAGHAFFINGGNTSVVDTCYALKCGPDKAGYRSLGGGLFLSCNGINSGGGSNFWFGGTATDTGDVNPGSAIFAAQLINCNCEDFGRFGILMKNQGTLDMHGGKFARNNAGSTYIAAVHADGTINARFHGNPRDDIVGTRRAEAGEGIASPLGADFNRQNASAKLSWEDRNTTPRTMTTGGANPKPMWTQAMDNVVVTLGIAGSSVAGANTVSSAVRYKLSGDSCRVWGRLTLTAKDVAMAGSVRLTGLPYTANASAGLCGSGAVSRADLVTLTGGRTQLGVEVTSSTDYIQLFQFGAGLGAAAVAAADISAGAIIDFDITYLL